MTHTPNEIHDLVRDIMRDVTDLHDRWVDEHTSEAWTRSSDLSYVTGGATSDPTGTVATTERRSDADRIADTLAHIASAARKRLETIEAREPSVPCATRGCEGLATHGRHCDRCYRWLRSNQHRGLTPDQVVREEKDPVTGEPTGKTRSLVDDWNDARPRKCNCSDLCCPRDEEGHTSCRDDAAPGRSVSNRCRSKMDRMKARLKDERRSA